uniref:Uncharacterized protein n=1 Tax=Anguilla anguilla TaxID=7936 RepID=A0A0E9Y0E2_ANGAN
MPYQSKLILLHTISFIFIDFICIVNKFEELEKSKGTIGEYCRFLSTLVCFINSHHPFTTSIMKRN